MAAAEYIAIICELSLCLSAQLRYSRENVVLSIAFSEAVKSFFVSRVRSKRLRSQAACNIHERRASLRTGGEEEASALHSYYESQNPYCVLATKRLMIYLVGIHTYVSAQIKGEVG